MNKEHMSSQKKKKKVSARLPFLKNPAKIRVVYLKYYSAMPSSYLKTKNIAHIYRSRQYIFTLQLFTFFKRSFKLRCD